MTYLFRPGTGDARLWRAVHEKNEYGLVDVAGKTIVDIGANIGAFTCLAAEMGANQVICIEPFSSNCEVLRHNTSLFDNIVVLERAIYSEDGQRLPMCTDEEYREFELSRESGRDYIEMGGVHVGSAEGASGGGFAESITLTSIVDDYAPTIDLLKIDCEGGEWEMFASTEVGVFARVREIVGEYHLGPENASRMLGPTVSPLEWLSDHFTKIGFKHSFRENSNNPNVGLFHAWRKELAAHSVPTTWLE